MFRVFNLAVKTASSFKAVFAYCRNAKVFQLRSHCFAMSCGGSSVQSPPAKSRRTSTDCDLRRTDDLRRSLPHMSAAAMSALVKFAKDNDISDIAATRKGIQLARDAKLADTPFGPQLTTQAVKGTSPSEDKTVVLVNPAAYLYNAYKAGGGFFDHLNACAAKHPSSVESPWRLAVYADEVVPGNALAASNSRKVWVVYFSFLELGQLSNENCWCPIAAEPTQGLKLVSAGISQVVKIIIKTFFGLLDYDMRGGVQLEGPTGERIRLFATLSMLLQDGAAQKLIWCCKGESGTKPCMLCRNLVTASSGLASASCGLTADMFKDVALPATNTSIRDIIKALDRFKVTETVGDFKRRQQACGFTWQRDGLLNDNSLEDLVHPADQFCHDWMHGLCSSGVCNIIIFLLLMHVQTLRPTIWSALRDYLLTWTWPESANFKNARRDLFSDAQVKSYKSAKHIKCSASEMLSILPVLSFYVCTVLRKIPGICTAACDALDRLADLVDALLAVRHSPDRISPEYVRSCVRTMLDACLAAGWEAWMTPKFHWCMHFHRHLRNWGVLPTCWVHERKHKLAKRYGEDIFNTVAYNKSVLSEVLAHQFYLVKLDGAFDDTISVLHPGKAKKTIVDIMRSLGVPDTAAITVSRKARIGTGSLCCKGDAALIRSMDGNNFVAGEIEMFICATGIDDFAFVNFWEFRSHCVESRSATWNVGNNMSLCALNEVLTSVMWKEVSAGVVRTLIPFEYNGLKAVAA